MAPTTNVLDANDRTDAAAAAAAPGPAGEEETEHATGRAMKNSGCSPSHSRSTPAMAVMPKGESRRVRDATVLRGP
ncbi:hypothetical protein CTI14_28060 [Methylobacterium radiotolerans]|nr:hypothetical protein CTI14_28060 [Methylobacterium radiotolerans]